MANETTLQVQETDKQELEQSEAERTRAGIVFVPRADIYEVEDAIYVVCDMPGVSEQSISITLEDHILTIDGHVESEQPEGYQLAYAEYRIGDYQRRFSVSSEIDQEAIEAKLKNGVLRLHLPKSKPSARKITVAAS